MREKMLLEDMHISTRGLREITRKESAKLFMYYKLNSVESVLVEHRAAWRETIKKIKQKLVKGRFNTKYDLWSYDSIRN